MKTRPAFTLVELLVYLGLTSVSLVVFMNFMIGIFDNARRADAAQQLSENGRLIVANLTQASRFTTGINDGLSDYANDPGKIVFTTATGTVTYDVVSGKIRKDAVALISNDVEITSFQPEHVGQTVNITMTIGSTAPMAQRPTPLTLTTSFTPRQAIYQ